MQLLQTFLISSLSLPNICGTLEEARRLRHIIIIVLIIIIIVIIINILLAVPPLLSVDYLFVCPRM